MFVSIQIPVWIHRCLRTPCQYAILIWPDRDDAVGNGMCETGTIGGKSTSDKFWQAASRNLRSQ